jgi:hypothetical protein
MEVQLMKQKISEMERQLQLAMEVQLKQKMSEMERQFSKWPRPGFRGFGTAAAQPAGTQQPTAA